ncbi:acyl-CoA dehydrogenase family protein [Vineibacter terrae]|uniref:acyl-CoA dehydrogenase family protein n=1 Tax=Vineibacter terrae TaxID=2586908 RepID=UPI0015B3FE1E|nr:acyl-CoA dehydrogenase family protein [Vineibacter terrae]
MTASAAAPGGHPVLDALNDVLPGIAARAEEIERARQLPAEIARMLIETGVFKLCVPAALGGHEAHPLVLMRAIEAASSADGSTGWNVMIGATSGTTAAYLAPDAAQLIHGDAKAVTGGIFAPRGKAVRDGDSWRVSGHWQWASGNSHCRWMKAGCVAWEEGRPRMVREGVPEVLTVYVPRERITFDDNWHTSGLCGTGSCDMRIDDVVVPASHAVSLTRDRPRIDGPLYRFPVFGLLALGCGAVALGIARGAIEDLRTLAGAKVPALSRRPLAERAGTQSDIARAEALVRAARAFVVEAITVAWEQAARGTGIGVEDRMALRLAATHATEAAAKAVDICYTLAGGTSVYRASSLQRRFRDVHVVTQHMMVAPPSYELAGRVLVRLPTDASML